MENPVQDVSGVIHALTQTPPADQYATIQRYFVPDAAFSHPFCRVEHGANSRWWIELIYRWYKIMSPRIEIDVKSVAFDEYNLRLYVNIHQVFKIWAIPFHYAPVDLVTVLDLVKYTPAAQQTSSYAAVASKDADKPKQLYFIKSQSDLYQVNEFVKFVDIFRIVWVGIYLWQWAATMFCAIGAYALWPVTWVEQNAPRRTGNETAEELMRDMSEEAYARGRLIAGDAFHKADVAAGNAVARGQQYAGAAYNRGHQIADDAYARGNAIAGEAYTKGHQIAGEAYNRGQKVADDAYARGEAIAEETYAEGQAVAKEGEERIERVNEVVLTGRLADAKKSS